MHLAQCIRAKTNSLNVNERIVLLTNEHSNLLLAIKSVSSQYFCTQTFREFVLVLQFILQNMCISSHFCNKTQSAHTHTHTHTHTAMHCTDII